MTNRITGLNSGLDTESLITALTQKYQDKVDKAKGNQTKLDWKRDKWKTLNSKVTKFFNSTLSPLRFSDAYNKKVTKASNSSAVSIVSGSSAMNTTQTMTVESLAKSAYLTGNEVTSSDKTGKLKFIMGGDEGSTDTFEVEVTAGMSLKDIASKISSASGGRVSANYDETQNRFYIGSKEEGKNASFKLDASGSNSDLVAALGLDSTNYIAGSDAHIKLNGVDYYSKNNVFSINGLTITANQEAKEEFTISTVNDTSGVYDMVKNFLKEYNELVNEFDKLYNADSAKKYSMLTDDLKKQMTEDDVKNWETKIKDGLFSKDETLYTLKSTMRDAMSTSFNLTNKDGETKSVSLATFGIGTLSYYKASENERNSFHIDGDKDDSAVSAEDDKLSALIAEDPELVTDFFSQLSQELYGKMNKLMAGTKYRSAYTIYEDKLMASQYSDYNTQISKAEAALNAKQDYYYSKFARMEKLMASINSTSSQVSGFFGGGTS